MCWSRGVQKKYLYYDLHNLPLQKHVSKYTSIWFYYKYYTFFTKIYLIDLNFIKFKDGLN